MSCICYPIKYFAPGLIDHSEACIKTKIINVMDQAMLINHMENVEDIPMIEHE